MCNQGPRPSISLALNSKKQQEKGAAASGLNCIRKPSRCDKVFGSDENLRAGRVSDNEAWERGGSAFFSTTANFEVECIQEYRLQVKNDEAESLEAVLKLRLG